MKNKILNIINTNENKIFKILMKDKKRNFKEIITILKDSFEQFKFINDKTNTDDELMIKKIYVLSSISKEYESMEEIDKSISYLDESINLILTNNFYIKKIEYFELYLNLIKNKTKHTNIDIKTIKEIINLIKKYMKTINDFNINESLKVHLIYFMKSLSSSSILNNTYIEDFLPLYEENSNIKKERFFIEDFNEANMRFEYLKLFVYSKDESDFNDLFKLMNNLKNIENIEDEPSIFFLYIRMNFFIFKETINKDETKNVTPLQNLKKIYTKEILERYKENIVFIQYYIEFLIIDIKWFYFKSKDFNLVLKEFNEFKFYYLNYNKYFNNNTNIKYYDFIEFCKNSLLNTSK